MEKVKEILQNNLVFKDLLAEFYDLQLLRINYSGGEYLTLTLDAKILIKIYDFDEYFEIFIHISDNHYDVLERNILHLRLHNFIVKYTNEIASKVSLDNSHYNMEIEKDEKSYIKFNWLFKILSKYL